MDLSACPAVLWSMPVPITMYLKHTGSNLYYDANETWNGFPLQDTGHYYKQSRMHHNKKNTAPKARRQPPQKVEFNTGCEERDKRLGEIRQARAAKTIQSGWKDHKGSSAEMCLSLRAHAAQQLEQNELEREFNRIQVGGYYPEHTEGDTSHLPKSIMASPSRKIKTDDHYNSHPSTKVHFNVSPSHGKYNM